MKKLGLPCVLVSVGVAAFLSTGCGDEFESCEANNACGSATGGTDGGTGATGGTSGTGGTGNTGGTSGTGATGGSGGDGGGCDTSKSPSEEACVIDDAYGVFVDPGATASVSDGTQAAPYKTISEALSKLGTKKKVFVCATNGSYAEAVSIDSAVDGVGIYGGFDCKTAGWPYSNSIKAKIESTSATAWKVSGLTNGLTLEDFEIAAANASQSGSSSFGMEVVNSNKVVLRRTKLVAGDGADGTPAADGTPGANGDPADTSQKGKNASCSSPPGSQTGGTWTGPKCGSQGGAGGTAYVNADGDSGKNGSPTDNVTGTTANAGGGATTVGANGGTGQSGATGNKGENGKVADAIGQFSATGYSPANGGDGTDGHPGQGGGGGGASKGTASCIGASGGAGGMGGCGGTKGTGGGGGGASVALFVWNSSVTLDTTELIAKSGGAGANGGNAGGGGSGTSGAAGGTGGSGLGSGGPGGLGGNGGNGGSGAGGTGGPSIALVLGGGASAPQQVGTVTLTNGTGGGKGGGGKVLVTLLDPAPDGSIGKSEQQYQQP